MFIRLIQKDGVEVSCSYIYRRPRGMFFSANDVGEMAQMVYNWEHDDVDAVVVSDGSR